MRRRDSLTAALGIRRGDLVAFVGGGGKTAAIIRLTEELRHRKWRVLASTTTRVGRSIESAMPVVEMAPDDGDGPVREALVREGAAFVTAGRGRNGKLAGVEPRAFEARLRSLADVVLVEADGSRQLPIKAPAIHEPVVPRSATLVVPMVGFDALGRPVIRGQVHRPELLRTLAPAGVVTPGVIVRVLTSERGALKGIPEPASIRPILNKVAPDFRQTAVWIARSVLAAGPERLDRVLAADIRAAEFSVVERPGG